MSTRKILRAAVVYGGFFLLCFALTIVLPIAFAWVLGMVMT